MDEASLEKAAGLLARSKTAIALTGAGISVASGVPDFRSPGGLWDRYDPMAVATTTALDRAPRQVWEFLLDAISVIGPAKPNPAHAALARLEAAGRLAGIVTQNIDGLHQAAGSKNVIEFHGGMERYFCMGCGRAHAPEAALSLTRADIPWRCEACGAVVRPDIVFFGEAIPLDALDKSGQLALAADLIIVAGTSGEVAPANLLPREVRARGGTVVEINLTESALTGLADVSIFAAAETALPALAERALS
ncbi:Silent information regulator protein Sir2 [Solidesulfovibrio fructosivorans JJ]]|uniref:protein acetyllysine N-acetyltransferase n=1 Tax=Solidesulfovibrio fructosivorans JJ] TaxID=596151 RepID=E1K0I9_SOLFR|nr:NAD-dependent deacylase [Solidesulfovibrio fructosivorans]EFL49841.1 Silent information regulator protein Sir2 [Solidesulfovibrio fructosivorans JJ]]